MSGIYTCWRVFRKIFVIMPKASATWSMPVPAIASKGSSARHDMSVILVTGSYDHEIRFWEAWSGICSRTIARTGESGVSWLHLLVGLLTSNSAASQPSSNLPGVSSMTIFFYSLGNNCSLSKRLLAAAIHKKVNIYEIANGTSDPVRIMPSQVHSKYQNLHSACHFWGSRHECDIDILPQRGKVASHR